MAQETGTDGLTGQGDDQLVALRVAQAIAWCTPRAQVNDPQWSLRSADLRPFIFSDSRVDTMSQLLSRRATSLWWQAQQSGPPEPKPVSSSADISPGRLLFCNIDESVTDGASEAESGGFFDIDDIAPWDTWVALHKDENGWDVLVCWVPSEFHEPVQRGIDVNCVDCVGWLAESRSPVAAAYRFHGLI